MTLGMPSATCTKLSTVIKLNKEPETTTPTAPQADINTMLCVVLLHLLLSLSSLTVIVLNLNGKLTVTANPIASDESLNRKSLLLRGMLYRLDKTRNPKNDSPSSGVKHKLD